MQPPDSLVLKLRSLMSNGLSELGYTTDISTEPPPELLEIGYPPTIKTIYSKWFDKDTVGRFSISYADNDGIRLQSVVQIHHAPLEKLRASFRGR